MDYFTFLVALLHVHKALGAEIFWDTKIKFAKNLTLDCRYTLSGTIAQIEWFKIDAKKKDSIAIFHPKFGSVIRDPYANRVYFLKSASDPQNVRLAFSNASEADAGFFSCRFEIFPYGPWEKVIQVVPPESFERVVSPDSHVVSKPGENITLMYKLQSQDPMQQVTWEKIQSHQIDVLIRCSLSQGTSSPSKFGRRILSNCSQGMKKSFILIPYVMFSDTGLYRCCFMNNTGENETFVVRLTVTTDVREDKQHFSWMIVGTVLSLLFIGLFAVVIVILYYRKRRRQINVQDKESQDTQNKASNYRSSFSVSQPSDGAGEDIYVNYPTISRGPKTRT